MNKKHRSKAVRRWVLLLAVALLPVFLSVGSLHLVTAAPNVPIIPAITEPQVDYQVLNPADVHMEAPIYNDPQGHPHECSDFEIWWIPDAPASPEKAWEAVCVTGVTKVHAHFGDGFFMNSHASGTALFFDSDYELRIRHKNDNDEYGGYAIRPFVTGPPTEVYPMLLQDIVNLPPPTWQDNAEVDVILPDNTPTSFLRVAGPGGELLLQFESFDGVTNDITEPGELNSHTAVRLQIQSGGGDLLIPETDLKFTDGDGVDRIVYLPSITLIPGETLYFWISENGSTYEGSAGQTEPDFSTLARGAAVPWTVPNGYKVEIVASGFQLPTNIAFVPNPGSDPDDPLYYVAELYGTIKVVLRDGTIMDYATDLLNFFPFGYFPGAGEQGMTGIVVDPDSGDVFASMLYSSDPANEPTQPGDPTVPHYPKVVRFASVDGGKTANTQTTILDMVGESQGQSHQISNLTIGPDGKLYVHVGDGFDASTALNLDSFRGKVLRMNLDGTAPTDNPFYNASVINARDYVFAYGLRNPFGGVWRAADGVHYNVENGPSRDRLTQIISGTSYGWTGLNTDMEINAIYVWNPAHAPVNGAFIEPETFGGSGFPAEKQDRLFVTESGPTWAEGPQTRGKRLVEFELDENGDLVSGPTTFVEYNGSGRATAVGLAAGPDGLYFTDLYKDIVPNSQEYAIVPGANVLRIQYVGSANFTADQTVGPIPLGVQFSDTSTVISPTAWLWDFGDGTTSTEQHPSHTYTQAGIYDVSLRVTGANGVSVYKEDDYIIAGLGIGLKGDYYNNMNFNTFIFSRIDPQVNFNWGQGTPHASLGNNTYSIRWSGLVEPLYSETYTFCTNSDDGARLWVNNVLVIDEWGPQGVTEHCGNIALSANTKYRLVLEYMEDGGDAIVQLNWESSSQSKEIIPQSQLYPFRAGFSADTLIGLSPLQVQFANTSYADGGTTWLWDFGDGATSAAAAPSHTYASTGSYTVTLTATSGTWQDTATRTAYITVVDPVEADFTADTTSGDAPLDVQFTNNSTAVGDVTWLWDFGDGSTSTQENPNHVYTIPGSYTVTLTVTSDYSQDTMTRTGYITVNEYNLYLPMITK